MRSILLVDDLQANLLALQATLAPLEANLICAESGEQALVVARETSFALALVDVMMPGMDGLTLARELKALHPASPIIFVTAHDATSELLLKGYALGALDYLVKPLNPLILRQKVAGFLELQARADQVLAERLRDAEERARQVQTEQQRAILDQLLAGAPMGLSVVSESGLFVELANERFRELWGLNGTEQQPLFGMIPEARAWLTPLLDRVSVEHTSTGATEIEIPRAGTSGRYVDVVVTRLAIGDASKLCVFWFDVTERVLACQAAVSANRVKDAFLTLVSHELRTPLAAITGWASLLKARVQSTLDAEFAARAVDVIERNARLQARIIEDILDVSRMVRGALTIERSVIDLNAVIQQVVEAAAPDAARGNVVLLSPVAESDFRVLGDEARLRQLVGNLLSNAVKFTPDGGQIVISLARGDGVVELSIADSGIGIDPEALNEIFLPFHQVDMASTRRSKGIGLGLAIVRHIAELHGGSVRAFSDGLGRGATMKVTFPVLDPEAPAESTLSSLESLAPAARPSLDGKRILVVDDSADAREFFAIALRSAGAEVCRAHSAQAALQALEGFVPHAVVSDLEMPDQDGFWLLERLRSFVPGIAAIAVSASVPALLPDSATAALFDEYVSKPVDGDTLVQVVAARLGHAQSSERDS